MPTALLTQLETAVRTGDRVRAFELARQIQQQLIRDQHAEAALERRVRELLAELDRPAPQVIAFDAHGSGGMPRRLCERAALLQGGIVLL